MAQYPVTGIPSSYRGPITAGEILLGQGPSAAPAPGRSAVYVGAMTSAGTWTPGQLYLVTSESDAILGAGNGSPLHRMIRKHLRVNPNSTVWAAPYAASSGAGAVSADGTITFSLSSGSNPSGNGQATLTVCGVQFTSFYNTSSTPTTIAADLVGKVNAATYLPVTASNVAGALKLTAKIAGASQGDGVLGIIRFRAVVTASTLVVATPTGAALGLGTGTPGVDGATSEATNLAAALSALANVRHYYMGFAVWSGTLLAAIQTHVTNKSLPSPGLRSAAFYPNTDTISNATTRAVALNFERMYMAWQKNSEHDGAELAAWLLANTQKFEAIDPAYAGFDGLSDAEILPVYSPSDFASATDLDTAARNGICAIQSTSTRAYLSMHVSNRSKDSTGTLDDFRATERHRVSAMDDLLDTLIVRWNQRKSNGGMKIADDPRNTDGTINRNGYGDLPQRTNTPEMAKKWALDIVREKVRAGTLQRLADWIAGSDCKIDPNNVSRFEFSLAGRTIDIAHQATFRLSETTPG
jgi:phage tail sheath gpL-like